jgi:hypothetical protein
MHLVGYLYEDYHGARSLEHKVFHLLENVEAFMEPDNPLPYSQE